MKTLNVNSRQKPLVNLKFLIAFVLFINCSTFVQSQSNLSFTPLPPRPDQPSEVLTITQDKSGFIWVALRFGGIYRYDGYEYKFFPEFNTTGSSEVFVDQDGNLWAGSAKGLHQYNLATGTFDHIPILNQIDSLPYQDLIGEQPAIFAIAQDKEKNLWMGSVGGGIFFRNNTTGEVKQYFYREGQGALMWNNVMARIHIDKQDQIWAECRKGGLLKLDRKTGQFLNLKLNPDDPLTWKTNKIYEDKEGYLWVTTYNGICKLDPLTHEVEHFPLNNIRCNFIYPKEDGNFWIATHQGVAIFNPKNGKYQKETAHSAILSELSDLAINHIFKDERGDYWFSTFGGEGVYFLDGTTAKFKLIRPDLIPWMDGKDPDRKNSILSVYEDNDSILWIGGKASKGPNLHLPTLTRLNQKNNTVQTFDVNANNPHSISDVTVLTIFEDQQNTIWIGTGGEKGGLNRFDKDKGGFQQYFAYPNPQNDRALIRNCIEEIFEDSQHNLWTMWRGGISLFDRELGSFIPVRHEEKDSLLISNYSAEVNRAFHWAWRDRGSFSKDSLHLSANIPYSINEDDSENIWLGTKLGLSKIDLASKTYIHIWPDTSQLAKRAFHPTTEIIKTKQNKFWILTDQLILFDPEKEEAIDSIKLPEIEFPVGSGYLEFEDKLGRIWITISKSNVETLFRYDPISNEMKKFGTQEGITGYSRAFKDDFKKSRSGKRSFSFSDQDGVFFFDPLHIQENDFRPPVVITAFTKYNSKEELGVPISDSIIVGKDSIQLTYQDNILNFKFAALNFNNAEDNQYAYLVEGFSKNWIELGNSRELTLTNLDPGEYTLRVKGSNNEGVWNEEARVLHMTITPPWWETSLAYFIYFLLLSGIVYTIFSFLRKRWQLQNQLKLEQAEAERVKELDAFKSTFYTNITHEFRTPLTVILGMVKQMREKPKQYLKEGTDLIERNGKTLLRQINQILDLSKLETNSLQLNMIQGDIVEFLRYCTEAFQSFANGQNLSLRFFSPVEKLVMDYDPDSIQNIMSNLISNAMKFTPDGGDVKIILQISEKQLTIKVQDTGVGILEKDLPHIFDRFYQAENGKDQNSYGTGVGLAYIQELVKVLGGDISVESEPGRGTTFCVQLPIRNEAALQEAALGQYTNPGWKPMQHRIDVVGTSKNIQFIAKTSTTKNDTLPQLLIIEDNADVVIYLKSCLSDLYQIEVAYNGRIGIEKAIENIPDLIISDVMMPEKDGYEVCDTLKNDERTSHIPITLLTAKADITSKIVGLKRGADAYLAKPFEKEELLVRLEMMIEKQKKLKTHFSKNIENRNAVDEQNPDSEEAIIVENVFVQKVRTIVEENYTNEDFALPQLCQKIGMSRSQLFRKMKALMDVSPSDFIRFYRLDKARELLESTDLNVAEAAYDTGFKDPSYFSKIFQEAFGYSPGTIKK